MLALTVPTFRVENISNWIYVTGVIRGGTTFLGKVLSFPRSVDYLHEPFHGGYTLPEGTPLRPRYVRPGQGNHADGEAYHEAVSKLFRYDIGMKTSKHDDDPWMRKAIKAVVGSRGPFWLRLAKINPFHTAAVIKDPVGKMLTEYLYFQFGVKPVIIVRHPASWVASLKRVGWWPGVREFAAQPHLVEDYLKDDRALLEKDWQTPMLKSTAHWRLTYKVLLALAAKHPNWQVVTHEELSERPVPIFRKLYQALDLPWSASIERKIQSHTQGNKSAKARNGRVQDFQRNSAAIFELRRDSLSKDERKAIFDIVHDVALQVYSRDSFAID